MYELSVTRTDSIRTGFSGTDTNNVLNVIAAYLAVSGFSCKSRISYSFNNAVFAVVRPI